MAQAGPLPAALAAALGPQAIAVPAPTTYRDHFAAMGDAYQGVYHPFLNAFLPEAQPGPAMVLTTALQLTAGIPGVFAYQESGTLRIRTIHRLTTATSTPGLPTPWDGANFAFEGDVTHPGLINAVHLPAQAFHLHAGGDADAACSRGQKEALGADLSEF